MLLEEYLNICRARRFNWLGWNCVHFTAGWIEYCEKSRAVLDLYAGDTLTARSALRYAASFGGLRNVYTMALKREALNPLQAIPGDVVLFDSTSPSSAGTLGICNGVSAVTLHPLGGFSSAPMAGASCIWKIKSTD